jgi:hypothetical protein
MRPLTLFLAAGGFVVACGGRSFEIIPGYNGAGQNGAHAGHAGSAGFGGRAAGSSGVSGAQDGGTVSGADGAGTAGDLVAGGTAGSAAAVGGSAPAAAGGSVAGNAGSSGVVCEGAVTTDVFDPNRVYLIGTLSSGWCGFDAIVAPECPNSAAVGFDCDFRGNSEPLQTSAQIRSTDGRLLYTSSAIRVFHCDDCPYLAPNANAYPRDGLANDPVVQSPCQQSQAFGSFFVSPEGQLYFWCSDGSWQNEDGVVVHSAENSMLAYVGHRGLALTKPRDPYYPISLVNVVDLATGRTSPITGLPDAAVHALRAVPPDRFLVFLVVEAELPSHDRSELWMIDASGKAEWLGEYPAFPTEVGPSPGAKLLPNGVLYQMANGPRVVHDVVVRRELGGVTEVVYTEADDPHVEVHISGLLTGP